LEDLLAEMLIVPVDHTIAKHCGQLRANLSARGVHIPFPDLLIGVTALQNNFTLVTHNIRHFAMIPNLRVQDWLI